MELAGEVLYCLSASRALVPLLRLFCRLTARGADTSPQLSDFFILASTVAGELSDTSEGKDSWRVVREGLLIVFACRQ